MSLHRASTLVDKVHGQWQLAPECHIIFSPSCPHYITSRKPISDSEFEQLLDKSGGSYGHAKLYVFEICEQTDLSPDVSCLEKLSEYVYAYKCVQWTPSNPVTLVTSQSVLIRGVASFQGWICTRKHTF